MDIRIILTNLSDGDVLYHSLALIKGRIQWNSCVSSQEQTISLRQSQNDLTVIETEWAVKNGAFKMLADLNPGANELTLTYCGTKLILTVTFMIRSSPLCVTPVYIILCEDDDGLFQAPESENNTVASACRRIWVGSRLVQCLASDKIGRTFQLAHDLDPSRDRVEIFRSRLPVHRARQMPGEELWQYFGRELMNSQLGNDKLKFLAFLSCTRYMPSGDEGVGTHQQMLALTEAHVALGGGGLALLGCGCLHAWPETVGDVVRRFLDATPVATHLMDDSGYRGTYGGCFSTSLGAACHELSHTFDLAHTTSGIMGREFNDIHTVFTLQSALKPRTRHSAIVFHSKLQTTDKQANTTDQSHLDDDVHWAPSCVALLRFHRWFNDDQCSLDMVGGLQFFTSRKLLTSTAGIRVVEIRNGHDLVIQSWQFLQGKGRDTFLLPTGSWCNPTHVLVAEDSAGNIVRVALNTIFC